MNNSILIRKIIVFFAAIVTANFVRNQKMLKKNFEKKINTLGSEVVNWKVTYYRNDPAVLAFFPMHE